MSTPLVEESTVSSSSHEKVVLRRRKPGGYRGANGILLSSSARPKSEYISPSGISTLDIRTRLRISEAELAIVQREVSDLLVERNTLETSARQCEDSWRFAVQECGRVVEERDELQRRLDMLEQAISAVHHHTPEKGRRSRVSKAELEQCKLALETQTRVCETLEHERDNAYDNFEFAQAQLHTLIRQYQDLASGCSEVARERDKAQVEVQLLKEELHRYEPELDGFSSRRNSLKRLDRSNSSSAGDLVIGGETSATVGSEECLATEDPLQLVQQIKELKDEKERFESLYEQAMKRAEQYQKQYYRAEDDRRQALATSEALTALWQKKFEKAQTENHDLRQELLSSQDRISHFHERLAMSRLQSRGSTPVRPSPVETTHPTLPYSFADPSPHRTSSFLSQGVSNCSTSVGSPSSSLSQTSPLSHLHFSSLSQSSTAPNLSGMVGRTGVLRTPNELISPTNASSFTPNARQRMFQEDLQDSGSHSTDEEGSWI